jgi:hypothetical protein
VLAIGRSFGGSGRRVCYLLDAVRKLAGWKSVAVGLYPVGRI